MIVLCDYLRLVPDRTIFPSYFARALKRRKESLVWRLDIFGSEVNASGIRPQNKITPCVFMAWQAFA